MQTFSQFALPGTILASALGAVVLCLVLLFYGVKSEPDDERAPARRLLVIRLGHAVAAACFAAALMLSTVALIDQRRVAPNPSIAPPAENTLRLAARVSELEQRLAATESRMSDAGSPSALVASPVAMESRRPAALPPARARKATVTVTKPASDDLGVRAREDWEEVKRGFREAGRDMRSGFVDLGRRIRHAFD